MEITFELDSDIDVEFESDWMRENYSDQSKVKWVFGSPNQGSMGGLLTCFKEHEPKYTTRFCSFEL